MATTTECLNPLSQAPRADRILVIRLGALGDVVRTLPAVSGLRALYPRAHISWLVEPPSAGIAAACPDVDDVMVVPRPDLETELRALRLANLARGVARLVRDLRQRRFDLVIDWHGILKSGLLARCSGAPVRVGYSGRHARELSTIFVNHRARLPTEAVSRFRRNAALITYLSGEDGSPRAGSIPIERETRKRMLDALGREGSAVVMHPGTSAGTEWKRWPPERYAEVARILFRETGSACLISSGPSGEERSLAEAVVASAEGAAELAPATRDVLDLAALYAECRLFIGSDSGPLHVASAVGTPVVQLMGPTHPVENEPNPATAWRRVRVALPCSPCRRGCAEASCMQAISSDAVVDAALELLDRSAGRARSAT